MNIYLVSTPLHLFFSSAIALSHPDEEHVLIFIDQIDVENNIYLNAVNGWSLSPFSECYIFQGGIKNILKKWQYRKKIFAKISHLTQTLKPKNVFVGNDRRIEFQYMMHCSQQYGGAKGVYLDEGIYTYLGRKNSQSISDKYIDNVAKKLSYGLWWKNPPTIGGSAWVSDVYAMFSEHVHPLLKTKTLLSLPIEQFAEAGIQELSERIMADTKVDQEKLSSVEVLITLPHESVALASDGYVGQLKKLMGSITNKIVAYKPHPRDLSDWHQAFASSNVIELPAKANYESLISRLNDVIVIGDFSSTLLMTKWLKPTSIVHAVMLDKSEGKFSALYRSIGVNLVYIDDLPQALSRA